MGGDVACSGQKLWQNEYQKYLLIWVKNYKWLSSIMYNDVLVTRKSLVTWYNVNFHLNNGSRSRLSRPEPDSRSGSTASTLIVHQHLIDDLMKGHSYTSISLFNPYSHALRCEVIFIKITSSLQCAIGKVELLLYLTDNTLRLVV